MDLYIILYYLCVILITTKKNTIMKTIKNFFTPATIFTLSLILIIATITIVTIAMGNGKYLLM